MSGYIYTTTGNVFAAEPIAQDAPEQEPDPTTSSTPKNSSTQETASWKPAAPMPKKFDWIQLKSDEWLKGELKVLYDNKLEFDSDELDLLQFNWEDVKQVLGHQMHSAQFEQNIIAVGVLRINETKVFIINGDEEQEFSRNQLISIAQGRPKEINYWSAKISLNLNLTSGNTDQLEYGTIINVKRRTAASRVSIDYIGNLTKTGDVETANNQRLGGFYDIFETRNFYWRPVFIEYFRDPFQNIDYRTTIGAGAGYQIIDTSKTEWDITPGLAYQYIRYESVEEGENIDESTPALVISTNYDTELTKISDFIVNYRFQLGNEESGGYSHHFIATLENDITSNLDLDVSLVWDRIENPKADENGVVPKQNDYRLLVGLGFDI